MNINLKHPVVVSLFTDQDGDKKLTLSEFISLPVGTVENQQAQDIDDDWVRERKKEFEEVIDSDRDGIVTMEELEVSNQPASSSVSPPHWTGSVGMVTQE